MRIAVTAEGPDLQSAVDPRFGRCPYFLILETDDLQSEAVENPNVSLGGGAGIQSAQLLTRKEVRTVLTGNCGPNAYQTLSAAGIEVVIGCSGTVRDAVDRFLTGQLTAASSPNVASHFGVGGPSTEAAAPGAGGTFAPPAGPGGGRSMGRGRGRGMGRGGGMGRGRAAGPAVGAGSIPPTGAAAGNPEQELRMLKRKAEALGEQMQQIQQRISELTRAADEANDA